MAFRSFLFFCVIFFTTTTHANSSIADLFDETISPHIENSFLYYAKINKKKLNNLVEKIAAYTPKPDQETETLAFYINAYNTLVIKGIIDGYGPHSLLSRYQFFKSNQYIVAGNEMNLDTLEHQVIRPLKEPRIHFALVCAAASCPPLRNEAYRASLLDDQLTNQAEIFINNKEKNSFDLSHNKSQLSSIFKWFEDDFLLETNSLNQYIAKYIKDNTLKEKLERDELKVSFKKYDWSLNGKR